MKTLTLLILLSAFLLVCCQSNQDIGKQMVQNCIKAHGGQINWESLNTMNYSKAVTLYDENGVIEKYIDQEHQYTMFPSLKGTIQWADSLSRKVVFENEEAYMVIDGLKKPPSESALKTFNTAYYVLNMPWKLLDESAKISYLGLDTILSNKVVHSLEVEYPSDPNNDSWIYYLDQEEYYIVANRVQHGSTYSFITNDEFTNYKGLKYNTKRTSYRIDSLGNILFVRAKYIYEFGDGKN